MEGIGRDVAQCSDMSLLAREDATHLPLPPHLKLLEIRGMMLKQKAGARRDKQAKHSSKLDLPSLQRWVAFHKPAVISLVLSTDYQHHIIEADS